MGELVVTKGVVVAECVETKYTAAVKGAGARWVGGRRVSHSIRMAASPRQKARNELVGAMEERLTRMRGVPSCIRLHYIFNRHFVIYRLLFHYFCTVQTFLLFIVQQLLKIKWGAGWEREGIWSYTFCVAAYHLGDLHSGVISDSSSSLAANTLPPSFLPSFLRLLICGGLVALVASQNPKHTCISEKLKIWIAAADSVGLL